MCAHADLLSVRRRRFVAVIASTTAPTLRIRAGVRTAFRFASAKCLPSTLFAVNRFAAIAIDADIAAAVFWQEMAKSALFAYAFAGLFVAIADGALWNQQVFLGLDRKNATTDTVLVFPIDILARGIGDVVLQILPTVPATAPPASVEYSGDGNAANVVVELGAAACIHAAVLHIVSIAQAIVVGQPNRKPLDCVVWRG